MGILARKAQRALQPPQYKTLERLAKDAVDILEEIAENGTLAPSPNNDDKTESMNHRIEQVLITARKIGL